MLKILSWNIQQGGGSRLSKIRSYINKSGAQILVLSEFRNNMSGLNLRNSLLLNGYRYQAVTHSKADTNSVIVASKIPFNSHLFPKSDPEYSGNILMAEFELFRLYGCYLPHKKKHGLIPFLNKEAAHDKPSIITGDLNTGINYIDQKGNSFWYEDQLMDFGKVGMYDAFREINDNVKEFSWYSHKGNGYRYDHFYIHEVLIPIAKNCYYDHAVREDKLSDHSAMFLELG